MLAQLANRRVLAHQHTKRFNPMLNALRRYARIQFGGPRIIMREVKPVSNAYTAVIHWKLWRDNHN